jgi:tRNA 2-selenouridine synthase
MSIHTVDAEVWFRTWDNIPIVDVRSPAEFHSGRLPGATNIPLFDNSERSKVGTLYKQVSREEAMLEGLRIVGPKMASFVQDVTNLAAGKKIAVYCWRGGMRSGAVAQLLDMAGFEVFVIKGGYKGYRKFTMDIISKPWPLYVITGSTGSGKTEVLHALKDLGEQVLDLEGLAHHKGSAFGGLMQPPQPSSEHMQNLIAQQLMGMDYNRRIWVEDESMNIGSVFMPDVFWTHLHRSPLFRVERSKEVRIKRLTFEYGMADKTMVAERIQKIHKKLGGQSTKDALAYVESGDVASVTEILLRYYDKAYATGIGDREPYIKHSIICADESAVDIAKELIQVSNTL